MQDFNEIFEKYTNLNEELEWYKYLLLFCY